MRTLRLTSTPIDCSLAVDKNWSRMRQITFHIATVMSRQWKKPNSAQLPSSASHLDHILLGHNCNVGAICPHLLKIQGFCVPTPLQCEISFEVCWYQHVIQDGKVVFATLGVRARIYICAPTTLAWWHESRASCVPISAVLRPSAVVPRIAGKFD